MRDYPDKNSSWDWNEVDRMQPEDWMLNLLKLNPDYCSWGPHEDYMWNDKEHSWASRLLYDSWDDFNITLDDLNEVVNFYFEIDRDAQNCTFCGGGGYHPDAQWVTESFHKSSSPFREITAEERHLIDAFNQKFGSNVGQTSVVTSQEAQYPKEEVLLRYDKGFREFCEEMRDGVGYWQDSLTDEDREVLEKAGRPIRDDDPIGVDAISRNILTEARCEKWGIPHSCPSCDGHGDEYTADECHVGLILWLLHPRKGASRGVHIKRVEQAQLPEVYQFLREARERNANRFGRIPDDVDKA